MLQSTLLIVIFDLKAKMASWFVVVQGTDGTPFLKVGNVKTINISFDLVCNYVKLLMISKGN